MRIAVIVVCALTCLAASARARTVYAYQRAFRADLPADFETDDRCSGGSLNFQHETRNILCVYKKSDDVSSRVWIMQMWPDVQAGQVSARQHLEAFWEDVARKLAPLRRKPGAIASTRLGNGATFTYFIGTSVIGFLTLDGDSYAVDAHRMGRDGLDSLRVLASLRSSRSGAAPSPSARPAAPAPAAGGAAADEERVIVGPGSPGQGGYPPRVMARLAAGMKAYNEDGDCSGAIREFKACLRLDPKNRDCRFFLDTVTADKKAGRCE